MLLCAMIFSVFPACLDSTIHTQTQAQAFQTTQTKTNPYPLDLSYCIYMGATDFSVRAGYQGNLVCIIQQLSLV